MDKRFLYMLTGCIAACVCMLFLPRDAAAQSASAVDSTPPAVVQAERISSDAPSVDGVLDERCWRAARPATGFRQREPVEGAPATLETEIRFCYDTRALYIGATMFVDDPAEIQSTMSRRDNTGNSARIIISLDTYDDNRTAYTYGMTADGVRFDYYHAEDEEHDRDYSFDPVWEGRVRRSDSAWTAEMRIPFSQLRFNEQDIQEWGVNINRFIPSRNEDTYWILIPKNKTGWSSRFGSLEGIRGISPSSRLEITPYAAFDVTSSQVENARDPFEEETEWSGNAGVNLKMGLGPNLTLDATINPDFGQVEADPAEVNLSAYETFYSERRPFFIEGSQLLEGEGPDYFYSRRIGAPPRLRPNAPFFDSPSNTTILGAGKLTGRLESGLSVAAVTAVTEREYAATYDPVTGERGEQEIEPLTGFGVMRVQQEFGKNASTVGLMLTGVQRDLRGGTAESFLTKQAFSGGADWKLRFDRGTYELEGFAGFSHVRGSEDAIERIQRSSAHFFQRPDADHVALDPTRTSLTGYTASISFDKLGGRHWLWGVSGRTESPEFEINDAGRLQAADDIGTSAWVRYRENIPGPVFHNYRFQVSGSNGWNFGGTRQYTNLGLSFNTTWKNFWSSAIYFDYGLGALSDHLTRGGPLMESGAGWNVGFSLSSNYSGDTRWSAWGSTFNDELGAWNYSFGGSITIRASGRLDISMDPSYTRSVSTRQYLATLPDGPAATFGKRYIFSTIDRGTLSVQFRVNYAFTPDLTLEVYAEPFAGSGDYIGFGELPAPRSRDLRIYGTEEGGDLAYDPATGTYTVTQDGEQQFSFPDPDFNVLSFRSNVVLRWEWVRGSTLFLVWQQNRYGFDPTGAIIAPNDLFRSFDSPGANFIALKITYWLPVT